MESVSLAPDLPKVCRLGLATRGNTHLEPKDFRYALDRGINYWNWCAHPDGMSNTVKGLNSDARDGIVLAMQLDVRTASEARAKLEWALGELGTDRVDIVTLYYVESDEEWQQITGPGGAMESLQAAKETGSIRMIGLTSHQRRLAASWVKTGLLDMLMIRYNAAHRGAEEDVFGVTSDLGVPVVAFTCLRWGALLEPTPADPAAFVPPTAAECYRFVLENPHVAVALTAPNGGGELRENLRILDTGFSLDPDRYDELLRHGDRVHRHARKFV